MTYLVFSALLSVCMFVLFRVFPIKGVNSTQAIYINYLICTAVGAAFDTTSFLTLSQPNNWWPFAFAIGLLFVLTFVVMSKSIATAGMTVSTVAAKISMVVPVLLNLLWFNTHQPITLRLVIGILVALPSIVLCSIQAGQADVKLTWRSLLIPLQLFIQAGITDTLINYANLHYVGEGEKAAFTSAVYLVCAVLGLVLLLIDYFKGNRISSTTIAGGVALGIPNYFSLFFMVHGLNSYQNNGALVFPTINLLTIMATAIVAFFAFKDKFSLYNWLGLGLALLGIVFLLPD